MYSEQKKIDSYLHYCTALIIILLLIGFIFIYSASSVFALEKCGTAHYFIKKQCIGLLLGLIGFFLFWKIPFLYIKKLSPFLFFSSLLITSLTLLESLSNKIHGSSRWLNIYGFSFQPSELLKCTLLLYVAYFLTTKRDRLSSLKHGYAPFMIIIAITAFILLKQPDFGMMLTLSLTAFTLFFIVQTNVRFIIATFLIIVPSIVILIWTKPYRLKRILTFLNPWDDPQGAGFQIIQSLIAIGSGHWFGIGISHSKQKFFYLPMQHTDFIFSIIAEETGFIGASFIIMLYMLLLYFGIRLALLLRDQFCALFVLGFILLTTFQAFINIAVATGLIPTKGIGLPFISYGNSALIVGLCMLGFVINCVNYDKYHKSSAW